MSFPNYHEKHTSESLLKAEDIVEYRKHLGRLPKFQKLDGVLFCLERGLPRRMRWRIPVRRVGGMNADVDEVKKNGVTVLTNFGGGCPIVVELAEELAVMGAHRMVTMTWGGILQPEIKAGDIVVCNRAIRDDGTSHHYLPHAKYIEADAQLAEQLAGAILARGAPCTIGATWTTDAPYRETLEEIKAYQAEGVKTVEMESAGLFTVGRVRGIATASVVIGMDSLAEYKWRVPERLDDIMRSLETVYAACIDVLGQPR
ncbi:MAG: nucleoside phosphorylase [Chloroflexi bacterium]|nr:nucleoside phosphorylase [Chloroflexota bacterium]